MLDISGFEERFKDICASDSWKRLLDDFESSERVLIVGNGGNLAVADHAAIDVSRLTNKAAFAPGSGILASSLIHESSHEEWVKNWLAISMRGVRKEDFRKTMIIGISSSGISHNIKKALSYGREIGIRTALLSGRRPTENLECNIIDLGVNDYHTGEVLTLLLFYQLIDGAGFTCPSIDEGTRTSDRRIDYAHKIQGG